MRFLVYCFLLIPLGQSVPAQHNGSPSKSCERRFLVGLNNYEPLVWREGGELKGLAHDIITVFKQRTGCQYIELELPRPSALDRLKHDRVDMLVLMVQGSEYEMGGHFLPFYNSHRELTVAKSAYVKGKKIEDYIADEKIKFAYMIGSRTVITEKEEERLLKSSRLIGTPSPEGAFRLLEEGRVQALLFSSLITSHYLKKMNMSKKIERVVDRSHKVPIGLYLSKRRVSKAEKEKFEKIMAEMKKDGSFLRIFSQYMSPEEAQSRLKDSDF